MSKIDLEFEAFMRSRTRIDDRDTFAAGWNAACAEIEPEINQLKSRLDFTIIEADCPFAENVKLRETSSRQAATVSELKERVGKLRAALEEIGAPLGVPLSLAQGDIKQACKDLNEERREKQLTALKALAADGEG